MNKRDKKVECEDRLNDDDINTTELYTFSSSIIKLLTTRFDFSQNGIAQVLGKSPSFVSHVNCGRRGLTFADLRKIESETGLPVFWLLLETTDETTIPDNLRNIYDVAKTFFNYTTIAKIVAKNAPK